MKEISNYVSLEGYDDGYKVGYKEGWHEGAEEAWRMVFHLYEMPADQLKEIFGYVDVSLIVSSMTFTEVCEKYKDFEATRLHVGDEFIKQGTTSRGIVTGISYPDDVCYYILKDGYAGRVSIENLIKTGNHYDINSILNEIDDTRD